MINIIKPNKIVINILGEQPPKKEICYRKYSFCFCLEKDGKYIAYHMTTRELIELDYEEYLLLQTENISYTDTISELIKKWFLVPINSDDIKLNDQVISMFKFFENKKGITYYTILPTTDCNARCFYCYEANVPKIKMSKQTALDVADYIEMKCCGEDIEFRWFGGEPLYNVEAIDLITETLASRGIPYKSTMVSNGYLFDDEIILKSKNTWKLEQIQITLDGTENVYNRCKNYIYTGNESPYKRVLRNIKKLINNEIFVSIRLNMDNHNKDDLYNLIDELYDYLGENKYYSIYAHLLYENSGNLQLSYADNKHSTLVNDFFTLEDYLFSKFNVLRRKLPKKPTHITCMANNDHALVILPDGRISKCEHALDDDIIGSIYDNKMDEKIINSWRELRPIIERCKTCKVFPDCRPLLKCETQRTCYESDQCNKYRNYERLIWKEYNKQKGNTCDSSLLKLDKSTP